MFDKSKNLIWVDLEMTGLNPKVDQILEIATLVTDSELNIIAEGPNLVIQQGVDVLSLMAPIVTKMHTDSGLIDKVLLSTTSLNDAEEQTLEFLRKYVLAGDSPICGNSIAMDRRFLFEYMPKLEQYFHYRHLDVSTVKILAKCWRADLFDNFKKENKHEALADIKESIAELKYYRENFFKC